MRILSQNAEVIGLTSATVDQSIGPGALLGDPTDSLIFTSILNHARDEPSEAKAFLSANTKDFGTGAVRQALREAGVEKYFSGAKDALGWLKSLPSP